MKQTTSQGPFFRMMANLFQTNKLVLYGRINTISDEEEQNVLELIKAHYKLESPGYPVRAPQFDVEVAVWSSKVLFHAAQLIMYRQHSAENLETFFPQFDKAKSESTIVSADICLRYMPSILKQLEFIDIEDELIPILKKILTEWHFSGLRSDLDLENADLSKILKHECLRKLYINRIIETKRKKLGQREELKPLVLAALGDYSNEFWKDFNVVI